MDYILGSIGHQKDATHGSSKHKDDPHYFENPHLTRECLCRFFKVVDSLLHYGYYYGFGATLGSDINITYNNIELRGVLRYHTWGSIEGRDRFQVEVTDDFHITDSKLQVKLSLEYWIPRMPVAFFGSFEGIGREGNIKDTRHKETENRLFLGLKFKF